jgi:hypothetical protein
MPHSIMNRSPLDTYVVLLEPGQMTSVFDAETDGLVAVMVAVLVAVLTGVVVEDELPRELTLELELLDVEVEVEVEVKITTELVLEELEMDMLVAVLTLVSVLEITCVDLVVEDEETSFAPQTGFEIGAPNVDLR